MTLKEQERQIIENIVFLAKETGSIGMIELQAGVSAGYLSRCVKSAKGITLRTLLKFAYALGVQPEDILSTNIMRERRIAALERELAELKGSDKDAV